MLEDLPTSETDLFDRWQDALDDPEYRAEIEECTRRNLQTWSGLAHKIPGFECV